MNVRSCHELTPSSFHSNDLGLYDMHVNVLEWCACVYDTDSYRKKIDSWADTGGSNEARADGDSYYYVLRGGSWSGSVQECCSAFRVWSRSGVRDKMGGFRLCLFSGSVGKQQEQARRAGAERRQSAVGCPAGVNAVKATDAAVAEGVGGTVLSPLRIFPGKISRRIAPAKIFRPSDS